MPITFKGMDRIEKLEIPEEALREILYNAIIHKDYTGVHIQMRVWDDYCEVWNEGELPAGFTPETLLGQHASRPRNRNIANAFFKAGFIDAWGRGYKKIREGFEGAGLPIPKIESAFGGARVTFQRNNVNNSQTTKKTTENGVEKSVEKSVEKILKLIARNPQITVKELTTLVDLSRRGVEKNIKKLQEQGLLRRVGPDKGGHWEINEK